MNQLVIHNAGIWLGLSSCDLMVLLMQNVIAHTPRVNLRKPKTALTRPPAANQRTVNGRVQRLVRYAWFIACNLLPGLTPPPVTANLGKHLLPLVRRKRVDLPRSCELGILLIITVARLSAFRDLCLVLTPKTVAAPFRPCASPTSKRRNFN